jgi:hypothetical protein
MNEKPDTKNEYSSGDKWLIAVLISGAILVVVAALFFIFAPRFG